MIFKVPSNPTHSMIVLLRLPKIRVRLARPQSPARQKYVPTAGSFGGPGVCSCWQMPPVASLSFLSAQPSRSCVSLSDRALLLRRCLEGLLSREGRRSRRGGGCLCSRPALGACTWEQVLRVRSPVSAQSRISGRSRVCVPARREGVTVS